MKHSKLKSVSFQELRKLEFWAWPQNNVILDEQKTGKYLYRRLGAEETNLWAEINQSDSTYQFFFFVVVVVLLKIFRKKMVFIQMLYKYC